MDEFQRARECGQIYDYDLPIGVFKSARPTPDGMNVYIFFTENIEPTVLFLEASENMDASDALIGSIFTDDVALFISSS